MTPDELRESYLRFFEEREHTRHPSDSLVPENDPTLLFTGAGMNQFKAMFLGRGGLAFSRATTSQKCLRMPDLENVGRTPSHHTFFEMLGNFSFGDYFKREAITWAWEYLASLGIPEERLSVTVYKDDDEAGAIWADEIGVPRERIFRCDEDENFWPASAPSKGPNGLCGPCSEIYFDFEPGTGPIPATGPGDGGARFLEIWNLVFTQFERKDGGELAPLPQRNIDTGMGFERTLRVVESLESGAVLPSNFETQLFTPIMRAIHEHIGRETSFGTAEGAGTRRIADHVRAACFCIADGVQPSNEKQGYVVRKVLRRAMLDRHLLGGDLRTPWLAVLAETVIDGMGKAYPDLVEARGMLTSVIAAEEERFAGAFLSGSQRLGVLAAEARKAGQAELSGDQAFLLYDTFGLPLDMQRQLLESDGLGVDEAGYREAMAEQRRRSRAGSKISDSIFDEGPLAAVSEQIPHTEFVRGSLELSETNILAIVEDAESPAPGSDASEASAETGASGAGAGATGSEQRHVIVLLDRTPFYAEGGGQVGDRGEIVGGSVGDSAGETFRIEIDDVVSLRGIALHRGVVVAGDPRPGPCHARVDARSRADTERNHTATHLLHAALHKVLGEDVTQAGSLVTPDRLRFDFRFPRAMTAEELLAVEDHVNHWVLGNQTVAAEEMSRDAARKLGAMALFGEKYGEQVRVVNVPNSSGPDSVELCGGTHVARSGDIGLLRILSEGSVAAGIRRIEGRTGFGVLQTLREDADRLRRSSGLFKTSPELLEERILATQAELKSSRRELDELRRQMLEGSLEQAIQERHGLKMLATVVHGLPLKKLRETAGDYVKRHCDLVLLAVPQDGGTGFLVAAGKPAQKAGFSARELVQGLCEALDGKGGGSPGFAQGQGGASDDLQAVLEGVLSATAGARS
jgi:alanyl-tRNA synthetase